MTTAIQEFLKVFNFGGKEKKDRHSQLRRTAPKPSNESLTAKTLRTYSNVIQNDPKHCWTPMTVRALHLEGPTVMTAPVNLVAHIPADTNKSRSFTEAYTARRIQDYRWTPLLVADVYRYVPRSVAEALEVARRWADHHQCFLRSEETAQDAENAILTVTDAAFVSGVELDDALAFAVAYEANVSAAYHAKRTRPTPTQEEMSAIRRRARAELLAQRKRTSKSRSISRRSSYHTKRYLLNPRNVCQGCGTGKNSHGKKATCAIPTP